MNLKNISLTFLVTIFCVGLTATTLSVKKSKKIKVGRPAPDFPLPASKQDSKDKPPMLSAFFGKKTIVLCIVPLMNSNFIPHCKKQVCQYNKYLKNFTDNDTEVIFTDDKKIAKLYGAYSWWWPLLERRTIIIDKTGKIKAIMKNVDYANNVHEVAKDLGITL